MGYPVGDLKMTASKTWTVQESEAFIEEFELGPWGSGTLSGLKFAVSDFIDIEERLTGCGNPQFLEKGAPAACNALILDILFSSGAQCIGKTKVDEFTFSLIGENGFYGTPLNPRSPGRVPGGPASGAASAVACDLVDFAVLLDSAAGTQVSASNCGLYGWRSAHGSLPMAGIMPMAPSFDSISFLSSSAQTLTKLIELFSVAGAPAAERALEICLLEDSWSRVEPAIAEVLRQSIAQLENKVALKTRKVSLRQISAADGAGDLVNWYQTYLELYRMEIWSSIGTWIQARKPELGKEARMNVHLSRLTDRGESRKFFKRKQIYGQSIKSYLKDKKVMALPSVPELAPEKGFISSQDDSGKYYPAALSIAAPQVISGLAQLSLPLAEIDGLPVGISFFAADEELLLSLLNRVCLS